MARKAKPQPAAPLEAPAPPQCSRCVNSATIRRRIDGRWEKLCLVCDLALHTEAATAQCRSLGISTTEQAIEWLRQHRVLVKHGPTREREPGEDQEEPRA